MGLISHIGEIFNFLTVKYELPKEGNKRFFWCVCVCGKELRARLDDLRSNQTSSCGCKPKIAKIKVGIFHGLANKHPLYAVWKNIRSRCYNKNNSRYKDYGGRGILMCDEWYNSFKCFYDWALSNGWDESLQVDREDNDKGYSPGNCRCVTNQINCLNKRTNVWYDYNGQKMTLLQVSNMTNIGFRCLYYRINKLGLSLDQALSIPQSINGYSKEARRMIKLIKQ